MAVVKSIFGPCICFSVSKRALKHYKNWSRIMDDFFHRTTTLEWGLESPPTHPTINLFPFPNLTPGKVEGLLKGRESPPSNINTNFPEILRRVSLHPEGRLWIQEGLQQLQQNRQSPQGGVTIKKMFCMWLLHPTLEIARDSKYLQIWIVMALW